MMPPLVWTKNKPPGPHLRAPAVHSRCEKWPKWCLRVIDQVVKEVLGIIWRGLRCFWEGSMGHWGSWSLWGGEGGFRGLYDIYSVINEGSSSLEDIGSLRWFEGLWRGFGGSKEDLQLSFFRSRLSFKTVLMSWRRFLESSLSFTGGLTFRRFNLTLRTF